MGPCPCCHHVYIAEIEIDKSRSVANHSRLATATKAQAPPQSTVSRPTRPNKRARRRCPSTGVTKDMRHPNGAVATYWLSGGERAEGGQKHTAPHRLIEFEVSSQARQPIIQMPMHGRLAFCRLGARGSGLSLRPSHTPYTTSSPRGAVTAGTTERSC
jgi:hypothetical protein